MRRRERLIEQEALVLLVDLPRVLIIKRAIVHPELQAALCCEPHKLQAFRLAARDGQPTRIPIVVQNGIRVLTKLQAALGKRLGIAQRKAEFQQVHAANAHRVKAHQKLFHRQPIMRTNRHFDHNIGNEGNRALNRVERTSMLGRKSLIAIELHAKANLVQAAIAQLCQTRIVK